MDPLLTDEEFSGGDEGEERKGEGCCHIGLFERLARMHIDAFEIALVPPTWRGAFATVIIYPILLVAFVISLLVFRYSVPSITETTSDDLGNCDSFEMTCQDRSGCTLSIGGAIPKGAKGIGWTPPLSSKTYAANKDLFGEDRLLMMKMGEVVDLSICSGATEFIDLSGNSLALFPHGSGNWIPEVGGMVPGQSATTIFTTKGTGNATAQTVNWLDDGFYVMAPAALWPSFSTYDPLVLESEKEVTVGSAEDGGVCKLIFAQENAQSSELVRYYEKQQDLRQRVTLHDARSGMVDSYGRWVLTATNVDFEVAIVGVAKKHEHQLVLNVWKSNGKVETSVATTTLSSNITTLHGVSGVPCSSVAFFVPSLDDQSAHLLRLDNGKTFSKTVRVCDKCVSSTPAKIAAGDQHVWVYTPDSGYLSVFDTNSLSKIDSINTATFFPPNALNSTIEVIQPANELLFIMVESYICVVTTSAPLKAKCKGIFPIQLAMSWALDPRLLLVSPTRKFAIAGYAVREPLDYDFGAWSSPPTLQGMAGGGILTRVDAEFDEDITRVSEVIATVSPSLDLPVTGIAENGEATSLQVFQEINKLKGTHSKRINLAKPEAFGLDSWPCVQTLSNSSSCIRINLASITVTRTIDFGITWVQLVGQVLGVLSGFLIVLRYTFVSPPFLQPATPATSTRYSIS